MYALEIEIQERDTVKILCLLLTMKDNLDLSM